MFDHAARGHNYGFPERILCASIAAGLLRGAAESNGTGLNDANDITSSDMGSTSDLHSGLFYRLTDTNCQ